MMERPDAEISTFVGVSGRGFDVDECTRAIGREPTEIWRQKRPHLRERVDLPDTEWMVGFQWRPFDAVDDAVRETISQIWDARSRFVAFAEAHHLSRFLVCSVRIWRERPLYNLTAQSLRQLGELGVEFSLDIYDYSEDDDDEDGDGEENPAKPKIALV